MGCHVTWAYRTDREFLTGVGDFCAEGIALGEKLLYLGPSGQEDRVFDCLAGSGLDPTVLARRGTLVVSTTEQAYLRTGRFDADARLRDYATEVRRAVEDGFAGLRVAADATSLLDHPAVRQRFVSYELRADILSRRLPLTALCAYDVGAARPEALQLVRAVHGLEVSDADSADPQFRLHAGDHGLVLSGEVDLCAAETVRSLLIDAADDLERLHVDVSNLSFIDVAGMRALAEAARGAARGRGPLRLRGASEHVRRVWTLAGFDTCSEVQLDGNGREAAA